MAISIFFFNVWDNALHMAKPDVTSTFFVCLWVLGLMLSHRILIGDIIV